MIKYLFKVFIFLFKLHFAMCCFDLLLFTLNAFVIIRFGFILILLVVYVLTVNKFNSYWCWICKKFGNFALFVYLNTRLKIRWTSSDYLFCYLCSKGHLEKGFVLYWLNQIFNLIPHVFILFSLLVFFSRS